MKTKKIVSIMLAFVMLAALSISASAVTVYNKSDLMPKAEVVTVDFSKYTKNEDYVSVTGNAGEINNFNGDWKYVERWRNNEYNNGPSTAKIADSKLTLIGTTASSDLSAAGIAIRNRVIAYKSDSLKNLSNNYKISFDFLKQSSNSDLMFRFNIPNDDRSNFYALVLPQPNKYASQPVWSLYQYTTGSNTVRTDLMTSERTTSGYIDEDNYNYVKDGKVTITVVDNAITVNLYCAATTAAGEGNTPYVFNETKTVTPANPISADASETFAGFCVLGTAYTEISSLKFENIPKLQTSVSCAYDGFNYNDKEIISVTSSSTPELANTFYPVDTEKNWYMRYGTLNGGATTSAGIESGKLKLGNGPAQSLDGTGNKAWALYRPNISEVRTKYEDWGIDNWNDDWQLTFDTVLTTKPTRVIALLDYYCDDKSESRDYYAVQITGKFKTTDTGIKLYKHTSSGWELLAEDSTVISTDKGSNDISTDNVTINKAGDTLTVKVYNTSYPSVVASVSYTEPNMFSNEKATFGFTHLTNNGTTRYVYVDNVKFVKNVEFIKDGASDLKEDFAYANTEYLYDVDTQPTAGVYEKIDAEGNWYTDYTNVNNKGNVRAKISGGELAMTGGPNESINSGFNRGWTLYRPNCDAVLDAFGEWGLEGWSGDYKLSFDGKLNKTTTRFSAVFDYASGSDDHYMVQVNGGWQGAPCFALYKKTAGVNEVETLAIDDHTFNGVFSDISTITFHIDITRKDNTITAELYNANNGDKIKTLSYTDEAAPQHTVATFGFTETALAGSNQKEFYTREAYIDNVSFVAYDEEADSSIMLNYGYKNIGENGNVLFGEYEDGVLKRILVGGGNGTSVTFNGYNPFRTYKAFFWNEFMPLQSPDTIN